MTAKSVVFFTLKTLLKTGKLLTLLVQYYPSRPQLQRSINLKFPFSLPFTYIGSNTNDSKKCGILYFKNTAKNW
jgi:hypothetical protein